MHWTSPKTMRQSSRYVCEDKKFSEGSEKEDNANEHRAVKQSLVQLLYRTRIPRLNCSRRFLVGRRQVRTFPKESGLVLLVLHKKPLFFDLISVFFQTDKKFVLLELLSRTNYLTWKAQVRQSVSRWRVNKYQTVLSLIPIFKNNENHLDGSRIHPCNFSNQRI